MNRITLFFLGLCFTLVSFGQVDNQKRWDGVIKEMTKANEGDTISIRSKASLEWSDFKKSPELNQDLIVHIELTFGVFSKKVNVWTGVITVESFGGIRRDLSWVNPQHKSQQLLDYLQLKYEIAQYFAKKSEKDINNRKINAANVNLINGIIETHLQGRDKAIRELDNQSDFGKSAEIIGNWRQKLRSNEL
jgi:hypothetical protein